MAEKILVVEDEPTLQETLAYNLKRQGYTVDLAGDGQSGIEAARRVQPNLIVLDIMMPEINGLELLHRLRSRPELCTGTKILVYTGARDRRLVMRKVEESRPDAILLKPTGVEDFLQVALPLLQPAAARMPGLGGC